MLSMKKILFVATLFLAAAVLGVTFFAGREQSSPRAATETPLTISPSPDLHGFLADKVADLANSIESPAEEPLPVKTGKEETADASGTAPIRRLPDREIIFRDDSAIEKFTEAINPDEEFLQLHASQFAYVEYKGKIGGRPLATICVDVNAKKCEVVGQGDRFNEVTVAEVNPDSLLLTHKSAPPLTKPLVPLEVEYKPMDQLSPEERQIRETRYRELYGNRMHQGSNQYRKEHGGKEFDPPSPEDQAQAAAVYQQTYGAFFRGLQDGTLQDTDHRGLPEDAPTLEESVSEYFNTYWPDQVEWEVSDENNHGEK
ncbi:MAG: hypothetical protein KC931_05720 [Candidatus Omnitrophica bacterium]|nr:hypothetical protein [Candidatus Omnitrophota bacterium]